MCIWKIWILLACRLTSDLRKRTSWNRSSIHISKNCSRFPDWRPIKATSNTFSWKSCCLLWIIHLDGAACDSVGYLLGRFDFLWLLFWIFKLYGQKETKDLIEFAVFIARKGKIVANWCWWGCWWADFINYDFWFIRSSNRF